MQVKYVKSKKSNNTVLTQSRKAGKKLGYRAVVKLTVATKVRLPRSPEPLAPGSTGGPGRRGGRALRMLPP